MASRTTYLFVVDAGSSMGETVSVQGREINKLDRALEYVRTKWASYAMRGLKTLTTGLVLTGQKKTKNVLTAAGKEGYEGVREVLEQQIPDSFMMDKLHRVKASTEQTDILSALIAGIAQVDSFVGTKKTGKNVILITDGEAETDWDEALVDSIVAKMNQENYELTVIGIDFDDEKIGFSQSGKSKAKKHNERALRSIVDRLESGLYGNIDRAMQAATGPVKQIVNSRATEVLLSIGDIEGDSKYTIQIPVCIKGLNKKASALTKDLLSTLGVDKKRKLADVVDPHVVSEGRQAKQPYKRPDLDSYGLAIQQSQADMESIFSRFTQQAVKKEADTNDDMVIDQFAEEPQEVRHYNVSKSQQNYYIFPEQLPGRNSLQVTAEREEELRAARARAQEIAEIDEDDPEREDDPNANGTSLVPVTTVLEKAYKYGGTLVPMEDVKDEAALQLKLDKSLEIIGFMTEKGIKREWLLDRSEYVYAKEGNKDAELKLSGMCTALAQRGWVAWARYCPASKAPKAFITVLYPRTSDEGTYQYFAMMQLPFAEDLKRFTFPSLTRIKTRGGRDLTEHPTLPTEEQNEAMSAFVDAMNLDNAFFDEDGDPEDWYDQSASYNPAIHNLKAAVLYRQTHPEDAELPAIHPALTKYFLTPPELVERAKPALQSLVEVMKVKVVPVKAATNRGKKDRNQDPANGEIDFDQFEMGDDDDGFGQFELEPAPQASTSKQSPLKAPKQSGSPQKPALNFDDDEPETETDDEDKIKPPPKPAATKLQLVSKENPIEDFRKYTAGDSRLLVQAVRSMLEVCDMLVADAGGKRWPLLMDCLKEVREFSREQEEISQYNDFLKQLKENCLEGPTPLRRRFWNEMIKPNPELGLIHSSEIDFTAEGVVSKKEADEFLV